MVLIIKENCCYVIPHRSHQRGPKQAVTLANDPQNLKCGEFHCAHHLDHRGQ